MKSKLTVVGLVLAAALTAYPALAGGGSTSPNGNRAAAASGLTDAQIERDIKMRLARSPKISLDKFTVKVQGGIATFEGKTGVIQHKGVATRMAKSAGAKAVINHIQISEEARKKAAQRLADGRAKRAQVTRSSPAPAAAAVSAGQAGNH
jgi:hypothetical protein